MIRNRKEKESVEQMLYDYQLEICGKRTDTSPVDLLRALIGSHRYLRKFCTEKLQALELAIEKGGGNEQRANTDRSGPRPVGIKNY